VAQRRRASAAVARCRSGHIRGYFRDAIRIESSGSANPPPIDGVPKSQARYFVEHVRERLNEAALTPPQQPARR
jgi:hypothetical protein